MTTQKINDLNSKERIGLELMMMRVEYTTQIVKSCSGLQC